MSWRLCQAFLISSSRTRPLTNTALLSALLITYLTLLAIAVDKHRKLGGHSKWAAGADNPAQSDDRLAPPPGVEIIDIEVAAPSGQPEMNQRSSVHYNTQDPYHPLRLNPTIGEDSFMHLVLEEICLIGGQSMDPVATSGDSSARTTPKGSDSGICVIGGEPTARQNPAAASGNTSGRPAQEVDIYCDIGGERT
jgi:hypothetical protein